MMMSDNACGFNPVDFRTLQSRFYLLDCRSIHACVQFLCHFCSVIMGNFTVDQRFTKILCRSPVVAHILNERLDDRSIVEGIVLSSYQCIWESSSSLHGTTFLIS